MVARIGLLWRDDRSTDVWSPRAQQRLGGLFTAFADLGVAAEPVRYADDAVDEVRDQLLRLDGVLVWVNPIQDGADRSRLDVLLREASAGGVWVSADPDVVARIGTKEVLYTTRGLGWGSDIDRYDSADDLATRFPARLRRDRVRVLKQARGNGGKGVWKVELLDDAGEAVRVVHAYDRRSEQTTLTAFVERCRDVFGWSGCLVDQPFVDRLADGMIRCYFVHDQVVGFCHQHPAGLLDVAPDVDPAARHVMEPADTPRYESLRRSAEGDWVPGMTALLQLDPHALPVIWDADFLYGPGDDSYLLCEINASAVWPFPPQATTALAAAAIARVQAGG